MDVNSMFLGEYDSDFMVSGDEHTPEDIEKQTWARSQQHSKVIKEGIKKMFRPDSGVSSINNAYTK